MADLKAVTHEKSPRYDRKRDERARAASALFNRAMTDPGTRIVPRRAGDLASQHAAGHRAALMQR